MSETKAQTKSSKKRGPRKVTPERLANQALYYLERYASSSENLRRVLSRKVYKASLAHPDTDKAQADTWIDDLIRRYQESGLLNDRQYAENKARSLTLAGNAPRLIQQKLMAKGVSADDIDAALEALKVDDPNPELTAALRLARKRGLGPYRQADKREERRDKDLAALARAGFSYDLARKIIEADSVEELREDDFT